MYNIDGKKIKLVVLGRGLAGCITASIFKYYSPQSEVELIYDSKIPPVPIGQATILDTPQILWDLFRPNLTWHDNPIKATFKTGILYENWGKKNDKFFHPFSFGHLGVHYNTDAIQDYMCENGRFKVIDKHISDYKDVDADYIFDCRGFPKTYDNYDMLVNPLNTALLARSEEVKPTQHWTRAVATPNGWTFDIPLTDHTSLGYLYNSDITTDEDATQNFNEIFDNPEIYKKMKFKKYLAKEPIIDNRIILNGNRLFFLEPLESTAVSIYLTWAIICFNMIFDKKNSPKQVSDLIRKTIQQVQNFILYHYGFGSKWDTPFWDYAKRLKDDNLTDLLFWKIMDYCNSVEEHAINTNEYQERTVYGTHHGMSFRNMYEGLGAK
tara:strand:- start:237 stop:1379 length:1143 start_codon:yes stop_codon:yes gene_type:complete